jgi:hypothetical protein
MIEASCVAINFIQDFYKIRLGLCHSADWEMSNIDNKMPPTEDLTPFRRNKSGRQDSQVHLGSTKKLSKQEALEKAKDKI